MTHITIERAKLDQVLETLERLRAPLRVNTSLDAYDVGRAITAIKQAQTQPVQEPFCFFYVENGEEYFAPKGAYVPDNAQPLYTTQPAARQWVRLTDEDKLTVRSMPWETLGGLMDNIEAKLKEKNHG